jgi:Peptidase_C39 like family
MTALPKPQVIVAPLTLPFAGPPAVAAARPGGATVLALAAHDAGGRLLGVVAGRQRRSAAVMRLTAWQAETDCAAALAEAFEAAARAAGALAIRATDDMLDAIAAFALEPTGRGYAQRWLGAGVDCDPQIGAFQQTTGFTCGPAALAMALQPEVTRHDEIALWREATTVIGLAGPGGCDPYGLALAAARRAKTVMLYIDTEQPVLLDRADTAEKRALMRFVQGEFKAAAKQALTVVPHALPVEEMQAAIAGGARVLLLVDQCHTHDHTAPHWLLAHAVGSFSGGDLFLVNDPWCEAEDGEVAADCDCLPMRAATLQTMGSYGAPPYRAAIVLR